MSSNPDLWKKWKWLPSHNDEGNGRESDLVSAEHGGDGDVEAGSHLTVGLQHDAGAEVVHRQNLKEDSEISDVIDISLQW